ncbi:MAG: hypothetical protein CVV22_11290 [Ignavibacteriae bacterium HGW-Ignavibacteriae-1]|jgi:hypothetical protein|nr:MAG: hypothetical protein CVV22_11290 [Ignavibacteriae bacterium HGW-Ignavibacteriae-1]
MKKFLTIILALLFASTSTQADFKVEEYIKFLEEHKDMSVDDLLGMYPAGAFLKEANTDFMNADFSKEIDSVYTLTDYEKALIAKHGFMVTERLNYPTFIHGFWDVFIKDMPIYISADAMLHALHYTYSSILPNIEEGNISPRLETGINTVKEYMKGIDTSDLPDNYYKALLDMDLYFSVTEMLLTTQFECTFPDNQAKVEEIKQMVKDLSPVEYPLFCDSPRKLDFSQFQIRGHYTRSVNLQRYFQAMMWLGRTEILISAPKFDPVNYFTKGDLDQMTLLTGLIAETVHRSGADKDFAWIDSMLVILVGRQDNINLWEIINAMDELQITALELADTNKLEIFRNKILELNSANQLYSSQILFSDPFDPNQVVPPAAFLLMGQRPIIDGFITANVTYDKILYKGGKVGRMVPQTLDILFSLGNDAAIQLMQKELKKYPYSSNLAALRYLIDSYDDSFWDENVYGSWINSIRSLNPPLNRENLPPFMQTAAWWQKTMNTQLASWAELRHDFLLYGKQPYTNGDLCSYPHGYVEPVPELYEEMKNLVKRINDFLPYTIQNTYHYWEYACDNLKSISEKILAGEEYSESDIDFLCSTIKKDMSCGGADLGWYMGLYPNFTANEFKYDYLEDDGFDSDKAVVADVHTIPTDEFGNKVGWVLHAGTGKINMAVITAPTPEGGMRSYIGPVSSYYEFISNDFKRLTNEEWREMDGAPAYRPASTNLYLADKEGNKPDGDIMSLFTYISNSTEDLPLATNNIRMKNHPNPFNHTTVINFVIPWNLDGQKANLSIYDIQGNRVITLFDQNVPANSYSMIWNGLDANDIAVPTGIYIYTLKIGEIIQSGKMNLIR